MEDQNAKMQDEEFMRRLECLPPKQREAAQQIFNAAERKSTRGMAYSKEWLLEWLIMKTKGPKLYEHMRKQEVLVLPRKGALQKYLRCYSLAKGLWL